jgi:hypothetical protein
MLALMTPTAVPLPDDIAALKAMVAARDQMIEALKLTISKLQQVPHGASSERKPQAPRSVGAATGRAAGERRPDIRGGSNCCTGGGCLCRG